MTDFYGSEIAPGARVVFNLSGELRIGFVTGFQETKAYYMQDWRTKERRPFILVQETGETAISKVTNPRSIVVLNEAVK